MSHTISKVDEKVVNMLLYGDTEMLRLGIKLLAQYPKDAIVDVFNSFGKLHPTITLKYKYINIRSRYTDVPAIAAGPESTWIFGNCMGCVYYLTEEERVTHLMDLKEHIVL